MYGTEFYDIVTQTEFMIELKPVDNIEDCGDDFLTREEVEEMGCGGYSYSHKRLMVNKVKARLASYLADIPKGKKSIIIKEDDLIEALKATDTFVSDLIPNTRRTGNRLFKHTKAEKKPQSEVTYKNWTSLIYMFQSYFRKSKVYLDVKMTDTDRVNTIAMLKKMATFDELKKMADESSYYNFDESDDELKWIEKLYNDPSLAPLPKSKKK